MNPSANFYRKDVAQSNHRGCHGYPASCYACPVCAGMTVQFAVECVSSLVWNTQSMAVIGNNELVAGSGTEAKSISGSSDFPMGSPNRIQIKSAAVEIDGDLEMVTIPESTGTFLNTTRATDMAATRPYLFENIISKKIDGYAYLLRLENEHEPQKTGKIVY